MGSYVENEERYGDVVVQMGCYGVVIDVICVVFYGQCVFGFYVWDIVGFKFVCYCCQMIGFFDFEFVEVWYEGVVFGKSGGNGQNWIFVDYGWCVFGWYSDVFELVGFYFEIFDFFVIGFLVVYDFDVFVYFD